MSKFDSILKKSAEIRDFKSFDVDAKWEQFTTILEQTGSLDLELRETNVCTNAETTHHIISFLAFAASLILIFSAIFVFRKQELLTAELSTTSKSENIQLSDGTKIKIGTYSTLEYYTSLHHQNLRSVSLKGEAFFDVSSSILPFKVFYGDIFVEVIGTSFTLSKTNDTVVIKNISGSVKVVESKNHNNLIVLNQGDICRYEGGRFLKPKTLIEFKSNNELPAVQPKNEKYPAKPEIVLTKGRRYTLEAVIKNYLIKFNKKKIKLDKKSKLDLKLIVSIDNINKSYLSVLQDLKNQGIIDFIAGDCADCYIIKAPQKNKDSNF